MLQESDVAAFKVVLIRRFLKIIERQFVIALVNPTRRTPDKRL